MDYIGTVKVSMQTGASGKYGTKETPGSEWIDIDLSEGV
jgi:hypothetical protein